MFYVFYQLIDFAGTILPLGAFLAELVLGILVASKKVKPTKILGIGFIIASVNMLTGNIPQFIARYVGSAVFARISAALSWTGSICSLAASFCICLFIHKRYGKKLIYIPVMAVPVVGSVASSLVALLLNRTAAPDRFLPIWITLTRSINNFITSTVAAVAIIIVLYRCRQKEDIVPSLWKMRLIVFIWSVIPFVNSTLYYAYVLVSSSKNGIRRDPFWFEYGHYNGLIFNLLNVLGCVAALIIPIYVFVMVCRASHKTENTGG